MVQTQAQRTLLKSLPELWSELSDPATLERHLGEISGELRITATHDDRSVRWEGERADGEVELAPAGWGTRVSVTVRRPAAPAAAPPPAPAPAAAQPQPAPAPPQRSLWARLFGRREPEPAEIVDAPAPTVDPPAPPEPPAHDAADAERRTSQLLASMLDNLGAAHHRPFSRDVG